ncbi:hypothetical protein [Mobiluncus mulieris]|uniref:hypothetical protein n=1 Tax=Mobiluncus mulieris TaxID=2052 RepID=UPI00242B160D|nr:hypothetical protein [Mobiluncus mulieris]
MLVARPSWLRPGLTQGQVVAWLTQRGIQVVDSPLTPTCHGVYDWRQRRVLISRSTPDAHRLAVLTHEALHVYNQHHVPQPSCVEQQINQAVACALIEMDEYVFWEREYSGHPGGIAKALGQPVWLVEAFQHTYRNLAARS